jgi:hypothetical protein
MNTIGVIKRVIPFVVTLTVGLFIASFFVDLAPRTFEFPEGRRRRCRNFERLYTQERERSERLQRELDRLRQNPINLKHTEPWEEQDLYVPPPPQMPAVRSTRSGR